VNAGETLLEVEELCTSFFTDEGEAKAVDGVSFTVRPGETLALVGESGSGKSVTALSIMRLFPSPPGRIVGGRLRLHWNGVVHDLVAASEPRMRRLRGSAISMIFQEPMTSLNPLLTVGEQVAEVLRAHTDLGRRAIARRTVEMLDRVGIAAPERRAHDYPHHLSGGMRQRVMIAVALVCAPALLIADEPTTALDVTIQGQVLELMRGLRAEFGMGLLFITHNLGVVAEIADRVAVMYAGRLVETADVLALFDHPRHPYTAALLRSLPRLCRGEAAPAGALEAIPGQIPSPFERPPGCPFAPRCGFARPRCTETVPPLEVTPGGQAVRCIRRREIVP
jgi:oligopeptide/dipeptide ABC transporter ATP-binding protein